MKYICITGVNSTFAPGKVYTIQYDSELTKSIFLGEPVYENFVGKFYNGVLKYFKSVREENLEKLGI